MDCQIFGYLLILTGSLEHGVKLPNGSYTGTLGMCDMRPTKQAFRFQKHSIESKKIHPF